MDDRGVCPCLFYGRCAIVKENGEEHDDADRGRSEAHIRGAPGADGTRPAEAVLLALADHIPDGFRCEPVGVAR